MFWTWSKDLPPSIEVDAIQLPGRENRFKEPPFRQIPPLVESLAAALAPRLTRPYALYGHSVGALIAFELARKLRREHGFGPSHLFVSAHRAPRHANQDPPIHQAPDHEFIRELQRRYDGIPEAIRQNQELMELLLPVLRADFGLTETYEYAAGEPLDCPITAFSGLKDTKVNADDLAFWRHETTQAFTLHMFPGDHFFLHSDHAVLLRLIARELTPLLTPFPGQSPIA